MSAGPFGPLQPSPGGSTGLSVPVQNQTQASNAADASTIVQGVPDDFVQMAQSVLTKRVGTQIFQIPQLNALILKIWQSPAIQYNWDQYRRDPRTWGAAVVQQVSNEVLSPVDDPSITVDYTNLKLASGRGLSLSEQAALANINQAQGALVPAPFNAGESGFAYGTPKPPGADWGGWDKHYGQDYGTAAGSRIVAPFAGTVEVKHDSYRGNQVVVHLDNGWSISFGHVAQGFGNGERVNPGDLIAISGQNVGISEGAVTLVELTDPRGAPQDPREVLNPIFAGVTYNQLRMPDGSPIPTALAGTGMPSVNKILDTEYPSVRSDWIRYFGSPPSPQDVYNVIKHGKSPDQWTDYIRSLPSHIPGLAAGNAFDLRNVADQISTKMYGHLSTDGIVAELHSQGLTKPSDIQYFYDMMPGKDLDKSDYNDLFHANTQVTYNIFNEKGADPRVISQQFADLREERGHAIHEGVSR